MTRGSAHPLAAVILAAAWLATHPALVAADHFTVVVSGATGSPDYVETYDRWRQQLVSVLRARPEFRDDHLVVLAETPGPGVGRASGDNVARVFRELGSRLTERCTLLVVLLGHGTYDGIEAKFNLVGPDLDSKAWNDLLARLPGRVVFVNTTASSFPFVRDLARPGRVVISATASIAQRYDTVFPEFFVQAFGDESADTDRDGRVSVWEAFTFSSGRVRQWYQRQGRLATERALLDDTGTGDGREAGTDGPPGGLAARVFVGAGVERAPVVGDATLAPLLERQRGLEERVLEWRTRKDAVSPDLYQRELERMLVELARLSRQIRQRMSSP